MTDKPWTDKYNNWRTSSEKHWAWRNQVAKFLRVKAAAEEKDNPTELPDMKDFK